MREEEQKQRVGTETASPRRCSSGLGPCTGVAKAFQGLVSHRCSFARLQNSPAKQRSGLSSQLGEWRLGETTAGENTEPMEKHLPWKISCAAGTPMDSIGAVARRDCPAEQGSGRPRPSWARCPLPGGHSYLIPSIC